MKHFFLFAFLLFFITIHSQEIRVQQLEYAVGLESIEKKCELFYSKKFVRESSSDESKIKLVNKKFVKRIQDFDIETITIAGDTITYTLIDPFKFVKFKKSVEFAYREISDTSPTEKEFKRKSYTFKLREADSENSSGKMIREYHFSIFETSTK